MDDTAKWIVEGLGSTLLCCLGYLLHRYITDLDKQIADLRSDRDKEREILFQLEHDLNEAWFHIRGLTGLGGGKRRCRFTHSWRTSHGSRPWQTGVPEDSGEP